MTAVSLSSTAIKIELLKTRLKEQVAGASYSRCLQTLKAKEAGERAILSQANWLEETLSKIKWGRSEELKQIQRLAAYDNHLRFLGQALGKIIELNQRELHSAKLACQQEAVRVCAEREKRESLRKSQTKLREIARLASESSENSEAEENFVYRKAFREE